MTTLDKLNRREYFLAKNKENRRAAMSEALLEYAAAIPEGPVCDPEAIDDLLTGHNIIRRLFLQRPEQIGRNNVLIKSGEPDPPILLIRSGYATRSCITAGGRRSMVDIFVPGDVCCIENAYTKYPSDEIRSIGLTRFQAVAAPIFRGLFLQPPAALRIMAIIAAARFRVERAAAMKMLDAKARICVILFDLYERLSRHGVISQPRYHLPFTQEQLGEYLGLSNVHVSRTLRRLDEDGIVHIDQRLVSIEDLNRLRECASGLPRGVPLPP
jgi:CRP/FNR family transcriptional regulator